MVVERAALARVGGALRCAFLTLALGLGGCGSRTDGVWVVETIDGQPVPPNSYNIAFTNDRITGGRDGCNGWSYADAEGGRVIMDAQECPGSAAQRAYWRSLPADRSIPPVSGDRLVISGNGHVLLMRRAR